MKRPRLEIPAGLLQRMDYPKFSGPVPRLFVLESNYWVDGACMRAAQKLGWELGRAPVLLEGSMPREMVAGLIEALVDFRPDFIFTVNLSGMDDAGLFAQIFADLQVPSAAWFVDDPRTILMDRDLYASPYAVGFTWEPSYRDYLLGCGFAESHALPLAVDETLFNTPPAETWDLPPSFVGHSMTAFAEREWAWAEDNPPVAQVVRKAFDAGRVTRANFAEGLESVVGPEPCAAFTPDERRHAELLCFVEGTRRLRRNVVAALFADGICAWGDAGWESIAPYWSGHVDYQHALPEVYRRAPVHLNTTSIQMATTVNQRVFDCPAAGGFLLTDAQSGLAQLFDVEKEVAVYHDLDEMRHLLRHYLAHPEQRRSMTERARKRILGEHTYAHRLERMANIMRARYGG